VLDLAAERAGWGKALPPGRGRGVSIVNNNGSYTAQIAEVSMQSGEFRIDRVICAVDCGIAINPAVAQQIRGGIAYGLSTLKSAITIKNGIVEQSNFHNYNVLHMDEMPPVEVHIVPSNQPPSAIGEASTPGAAPAVCNAIFAASGKRIRRLPILPKDLDAATGDVFDSHEEPRPFREAYPLLRIDWRNLCGDLNGHFLRGLSGGRCLRVHPCERNADAMQTTNFPFGATCSSGDHGLNQSARSP
jgi:hypothetical protein